MAPPVEDSPSVSELSHQLLDGRYRLESLIGRGGMGTVYRALDSRLERPVAVKLLTDAPGADEERFDAEVRTLARLSHPNLVRLLDAGEFDGHLYLVMDLVEGTNLAARLRSGALSEGETAAIGAGVAAALDYVHNEGVVHRDVKPANILLDGRGAAYLTDFGIARLADSSGLTVTGMLFGTPAYLAPEQLQGAAVGPSADVYALGLVLIECLGGERAFTGTLSEVTAGRLLRDPEIPAGFEEGWGPLLRAMTARDPGARLAAAAVGAELLAPRHAVPGGPALGAAAIGFGDTSPMSAGSGFGAAGHRGGATETFEATAILPGTTAATTAATAKMGPEAAAGTTAETAVLVGGSADPPGRFSADRRNRLLVVAAACLVIALLLGLGLGGVLSGSRSPSALQHRSNARGSHSTSTTSTTTTSTSTTSTTTTTTLPAPTVASAAGGLVAALERGVTSGGVTSQAGQGLVSQLQPLLFSSGSAPSQQQTRQFDQLVQSFQQDVANGQITGAATVASLTRSLALLAKALGVTVPSATTTTTQPVPPAGSQPPGKGKGKGNGNGNGNGDGHGNN